jgi:hypothetical protein
MSTHDIRPVSSKEHMLSPTDIFVVAAHEYKDGLRVASAAAKKARISPERMSYAIMLKEYSDPRLIRLREGNTLFTIAALPSRAGFVRGYNGDTADVYTNNIAEFFITARKLGFDVLAMHATPDAARAIKIAVRKAQTKLPDIDAKFNPSSNEAVVKTGETRSR